MMLRDCRFIGWLASVAVLLFWGGTYANTGALLVDFSAFEVLALRFAIAWAVLWAVGRWRVCPRTGSQGLFAAMGFTGVVTCQFLENCAIHLTNASNVAILMAFGPLVTALFAARFSSDIRLTPRFLVGSGVAVCGAALAGVERFTDLDPWVYGNLVVVGSLVSWGAYSVLLDRANRLGVPAVESIGRSFGWALVMMAPIAVLGMTEWGRTAFGGSFAVRIDPGENMRRLSSAANLFNITFLGVFASALCHVLWAVASRRLGVVAVNAVLYFTPVVGVLSAVVFLDESLSPRFLLGGALVLVGVTYSHVASGCGAPNGS